MGFLFFSCFQGIHTCIYMEGKRLKSLALLHTDAHRLKDIYMYLPFNVRNPQHKKEAVHLPSPLCSKEWRYVQLSWKRLCFNVIDVDF